MLIVVGTNLAIRFYVSAGWTEDKVRSYLVDPVAPLAYFHHEEIGFRYWVPEVGTSINIEKLLKDGVGVRRTFNDYPMQSDYQYLLDKNW